MGILNYECILCHKSFKWENVSSLHVQSKATNTVYENALKMREAEGQCAIGTWDAVCEACYKTVLQVTEEEKIPFLMTTTSSFEGEKIIEYKGIITSQVFLGVNIFRDIFAGIRDIVGGRSKAIENEFNRAKKILLSEITSAAIKLQANAIVGLKIDFEEIGKTSNAFMLMATGTAVVLENRPIFDRSDFVEKYKDIIETNLNSRDLFQKAYDLHYKKYDLELAEAHYKLVIEKFPDSPEAGYAKTQLRNLEEDRR